MRLLVLAILSVVSLSIFAQKQMTIRNSETGEEMTITVPDGLVITSGYENEDGDMVVCDTIYADYDECFDDTIACDTVYVDELQSGDNTFALAQQYRTEGKYFETVIALYQSWLMGKQDEVDSFIGENKNIKKQINQYVKDYRFTYSGILKSLKYSSLSKLALRIIEYNLACN